MKKKGKQGDVVPGNFGPGVEDVPVLKKRLAAMFDRSTRWVEQRTADGMPSDLDRRGRRIYIPSECREWLAKHYPRARDLQLPEAKPAGMARRRQAPASRPPDPPPAKSEPVADGSRDEAIAALEKAIEGLQRQLVALRGGPPAA